MHWPFPSFAASRIVALAALVCSTRALDAQGTGIIRGRVTDAANGSPVANAAVTITGRPQAAVTSASGDYAIAGVAAGSVEVAARRIGYTRVARTVNVTASAETRVDFSLPVAVSTLDAVVVTGTGGGAEKRTLGNAITQLDVAELTTKTSMVNVTEVLQSKSPGVTILPGSGVPGTAGEIRIRGASSLSGYKPVVFIDGIRFNIEDLGGFSATVAAHWVWRSRRR